MKRTHRITNEDFQFMRLNLAKTLADNGVAIAINVMAQRAIEEAYIKLKKEKDNE